MSVWREVQETLYQRFADAWAATTPYTLENETGFDPPNAQWVKVSVKQQPGGQGSMGPPGDRRFDRVGIVFMQLREPPGGGVGALSDLAEQAKVIYEGCRFGPHDIRFAAAQIGDESEVDEGRWWGCLVQARFDYEEIR